MAKSKTSAELPQTGKRVKLRDHKAKPVFFKPKVVGDHLLGRVMRYSDGGEYGPSVRLSTAQGPVSCSVNIILSEIDWKAVLGKIVDIIFVGTVGKRGCRNYDVDLIESDDVPF